MTTTRMEPVRLGTPMPCSGASPVASCPPECECPPELVPCRNEVLRAQECDGKCARGECICPVDDEVW